MSNPTNDRHWREHLNPRLKLLTGGKITRARTVPDDEGNLWIELCVSVPSQKGRVHKITVSCDSEQNRPGMLIGLPDPA